MADPESLRLPRFRPRRQPQPVRGDQLRPPGQAGRAGAGGVRRGPRPLPGRHRRRGLVDLRRELLGRSGARRRPEEGRGPARRDRAGRRSLRRRDGDDAGLDRLPAGGQARRGLAAPSRAHPPRDEAAHPDAVPGTGRLLVDGLRRPHRQQLESLDRLQLAGGGSPPRGRRRPPRAGGTQRHGLPGQLPQSLPRGRRLRRRAGVLGQGGRLALRRPRNPGRGQRWGDRCLRSASHPRNRALHRPGLHRRPLVHQLRRRLGRAVTQRLAHLPLRQGGQGRDPGRIRGLPGRKTGLGERRRARQLRLVWPRAACALHTGGDSRGAGPGAAPSRFLDARAFRS